MLFQYNSPSIGNRIVQLLSCLSKDWSDRISHHSEVFDFDSFLLCYHSEEKCRRLQDHQISLGSKKWFLVAGAKAEQEIAPLAYILKGLPPIEMSLKRYQS